MKTLKYMLTVAATLLLWSGVASAQADRRDVRRGNREFRKENYQSADISYRKALMADSLSFAAAYNLGNTLYREGDMEQAKSTFGRIADYAASSARGADYYFNVGDVALQQKDYKTAVDAFRKSLLIDPGDIAAKENYIYARKMLQDDENQDGGQDQDQDDDQNQDQDQNQNQNQNQNDNGDNGSNDDKDGDDSEDNDSSGNDGDVRGSGLSSQQAQQLLQAIQAKEKETQDKVNKEKAAILKSKQKEKNW